MGRKLPSRDSVRRIYDAAAARYDDGNGLRKELRFRIVDAPLLRVARAGRVLEIGCGTGRLLARARATVRIGVDLSPDMLRRARARDLAVACADAHHLPFPDASFDAVIAGNASFRYLEYSRAFAECARVLVPGGRLGVHQYAALTWGPSSLWRRPVPEPLHLEDLEELEAPARRAGLDVIARHRWRSVRFPPFALPVPAAVPGRLWSHCVLIARRPTGRSGTP